MSPDNQLSPCFSSQCSVLICSVIALDSVQTHLDLLSQGVPSERVLGRQICLCLLPSSSGLSPGKNIRRLHLVFPVCHRCLREGHRTERYSRKGNWKGYPDTVGACRAPTVVDFWAWHHKSLHGQLLSLAGPVLPVPRRKHFPCHLKRAQNFYELHGKDF